MLLLQSFVFVFGERIWKSSCENQVKSVPCCWENIFDFINSFGVKVDTWPYGKGHPIRGTFSFMWFARRRSGAKVDPPLRGLYSVGVCAAPKFVIAQLFLCDFQKALLSIQATAPPLALHPLTPPNPARESKVARRSPCATYFPK